MEKKYGNISVKTKKFTKGTHRSLTSLGVHLLREHKENYKLADEKRVKENDVLISMEGKTLAQSLNSFLEKNELATRNSETIQAYQIVFSIPKEIFGNKNLIEEFKKSTLEFINTNTIFKDNCLLCVYHGDETQPHIQAVFVPRHEGKLNFKHLLGGPTGPQKLHKLHDDFEKAVLKKLGLHRGDGTHTNGLDYKPYMKAVAAFNDPVDTLAPVEEVTPTWNPIKNVELLKNQNDILKKQNATLKKNNKKIVFFQNQNLELKKINTKIKKVNSVMKKQFAKMSNDDLEKLRLIDCSDVLKILGFEPKKEGITTRLKTDNLNLVVNSENKFTENKSGTAGGGAIDLLVKVFEYSFKEAKDFLSQNFGFERTAKLITTNSTNVETVLKSELKKSSLEIPKPVFKNLDKIKKYLTETRKIKKEIIDDLISKNLLFADSKSNCVFTNEQNSFAFIRGTYEEKKFVGVKGEIDFIKYDFDKSKTNEIYLFESTIDALSYKTLNPEKNGLYVVLNGSALINKVHELELDKFSKVVCCFDNDETGKKFCDKINQSTTSKVEIETPTGKDFNEDLKNGYIDKTPKFKR